MLNLLPSPLNEEYSQQLKILEGLLQNCGYPAVRAYQCSRLPHFSRLDEPKKIQILCALKAYNEALYETLNSDKITYGQNLDMSQFVWRFLQRMGITPSENLCVLLNGEDFIQIYNSNEFQIFRSLRCFERCSFTLEELTCKSWYELWDRPNLFYFALTGLVAKILSFIKPTYLPLDFPYHTVREVNSECLFEFRYKIKSVSVLTRHKKTQAAVLIEDWKY